MCPKRTYNVCTFGEASGRTCPSRPCEKTNVRSISRGSRGSTWRHAGPRRCRGRRSLSLASRCAPAAAASDAPLVALAGVRNAEAGQVGQARIRKVLAAARADGRVLLLALRRAGPADGAGVTGAAAADVRFVGAILVFGAGAPGKSAAADRLAKRIGAGPAAVGRAFTGVALVVGVLRVAGCARLGGFAGLERIVVVVAVVRAAELAAGVRALRAGDERVAGARWLGRSVRNGTGRLGTRGIRACPAAVVRTGAGVAAIASGLHRAEFALRGAADQGAAPLPLDAGARVAAVPGGHGVAVFALARIRTPRLAARIASVAASAAFRSAGADAAAGSVGPATTIAAAGSVVRIRIVRHPAARRSGERQREPNKPTPNAHARNLARLAAGGAERWGPGNGKSAGPGGIFCCGGTGFR